MRVAKPAATISYTLEIAVYIAVMSHDDQAKRYGPEVEELHRLSDVHTASTIIGTDDESDLLHEVYMNSVATAFFAVSQRVRKSNMCIRGRRI